MAAAERTFEAPPNLLALYGKAALGGIPFADKVPVLGIGGRSKEIPETTLVVPEATVDVDRLAEYCRVCGFTLRDTLPITYPHMLAFPLHMSLMLSLIHI